MILWIKQTHLLLNKLLFKNYLQLCFWLTLFHIRSIYKFLYKIFLFIFSITYPLSYHHLRNPKLGGNLIVRNLGYSKLVRAKLTYYEVILMFQS